ncbi:MAG: thiamine monophosphate synthase [Crocinitomix sp.]|jgi:thiamine monophosphate synthase
MNKILAKIQILVDQETDFKQEKKSNKVNYLVKDDVDLADKIGVDGVLISDLERDLSSIRISHPDLLIGGLAYDLADCKNWEMKGVDFIQFFMPENGSPQGVILGSELLQDIIPREEEYGWMILSLNKPVFVLGVSDFEELKLVQEKTTIHGVVFTNQFEQKISLEERIDKMEELLN